MTTASAATPDDQDPITQAFVQTIGQTALDNQDAMSTFRGWMLDQPGFATSGYVGSSDDLAHKATTIMWSGARTPLLTAILAEGQRRGIATTVQQRTYSLAQLTAATNAVWQQAASGAWAGFAISSINAVGDTETGLTVNGTYTSVPQAQRAPQVQSLSTTVAGVPVHIVPGETAENASGRDDDHPPFAAGGFMVGPNRTTCSSGFAITSNSVSRTTTARHCRDVPYRAFHGNGDYSTVIYTSANGGGSVLGGAGAPRVRTGPHTSNTSMPVTGLQDLALHDVVCTSGGNSGEHCSVEVTDLNVTFDDGHGRPLETIEGTQQKGDDIAAMKGDSGGPVLVPHRNSGAKAAGMIQAIRNHLPQNKCGSSFVTAPCSKKVLFTSMRVIINTLPLDSHLSTTNAN